MTRPWTNGGDRPFMRLKLDHTKAAWLEDLVADERWHLRKEMRENRIEGKDDPVRLSEVSLAEDVLKFIRGAMEEAGWEHG